ncbi:MAG: hypothetical protein AAGU78_00245 [Chloroflexota bacterium]|jgi:hypothetical protein|nr:hypothetical protein [Anaerolineae bacterium]NUQ36020.1 hypothetical protein [Planctomycetaceae bacterium]HMM29710.1 hypothetical protein [Aggregatilineaceae bacterium]
MQQFRVWWNSFKTVAIWISFITNMVLLIVSILLLMQLFQIKNGIVEPLVDGLHRNFVGLDEAVIIRTIEVSDDIPVIFDLPVNQETDVVLTADVPLAANATFTLPGGGGLINGRVDIVLPQNLVLPVRLSMNVPVNTQIPVDMPVEVEIPLNETQLHDPFVNLRELLEPYVRVLDHLPERWGQVPDFLIDVWQGDGVNLLAPTAESADPWPGFTTGVRSETGDTVPPPGG